MLADVPVVFILAGLAAYALLGGADFGAGFWTLFSGGDRDGASIREHARHTIGPVWEANHVWLIFVLVVCWTAYPSVFASIFSTLTIPLFIAAIGIILRGSAYATRNMAGVHGAAVIDRVFGVSSILTPFALGAAIGGIASGRVPVGNAQGDLVTSWLNPTSIVVGLIAVATAAYLAAVYLAADAARHGEPELLSAMRLRALGAGVVAGAVAVAGLIVVHFDAKPLAHGLAHGAGLAAVIVSGVSGAATLALVARSRFELARLTAGLAVAAVIAGWALAQRPYLLPGLTVHEAAAGHATLVAVIIAVVLGALVLGPSLVLLFSLVLGGHFERPPSGVAPAPELAPNVARTTAAVAGSVACLGVGAALLVFADGLGAQLAGAVALVGFVALAFPALARSPDEGPAP
jgi:cytochrome bd ubiquinol oxidase subunit II